MKTVKTVSEITGVSIRTLRYYDAIGLLKPTRLTDAGYRLYDEKALETLQEIMFFRELSVPLPAIKIIMENPGYNKRQILLSHKIILEQKRNRLNGLLELIDDVMEGVNTMSFKAFHQNDAQEIIANIQKNLSPQEFSVFLQQQECTTMEEFEKKLIHSLNSGKNKTDILRWYGGKEKVIASSKPVNNLEEIQEEHTNITKHLAAIKDANNLQEEGHLIAKMAEHYKKMLHLDNPRAFMLDLAKQFSQDNTIAAAQDSQYGCGTTKYISEAIQRYYGVFEFK